MKTRIEISAFNAGPKKDTTSQEEATWIVNKARYKKHFSAERELNRMRKDSYCGEKYEVIIIQLRSLGVSTLNIWIMLNSDPYSVVVKGICEEHNLDYIEVRNTLIRL